MEGWVDGGVEGTCVVVWKGLLSADDDLFSREEVLEEEEG